MMQSGMPIKNFEQSVMCNRYCSKFFWAIVNDVIGIVENFLEQSGMMQL